MGGVLALINRVGMDESASTSQNRESKGSKRDLPPRYIQYQRVTTKLDVAGSSRPRGRPRSKTVRLYMPHA